MTNDNSETITCPWCAKIIHKSKYDKHTCAQGRRKKKKIHKTYCEGCEQWILTKKLNKHTCYKPRSIRTISGGGGPGTGKKA
jgi:hypothetical protein